MSGLEEKDAYGFDVVGDQTPGNKERSDTDAFGTTVEANRATAEKIVPKIESAFDVV